MTEADIVGDQQTYLCDIYGSDEKIVLKEKDIPLVVVEEYEKLGSLENHQEVNKISFLFAFWVLFKKRFKSVVLAFLHSIWIKKRFNSDIWYLKGSERTEQPETNIGATL